MTRTRDSATFLAQLEPLRHQLYGYAYRALNRPEAVGDVLQDVVLTAWRELPSFVPGTNFRAWVFRILVNTAFNFNKRHARNRTLSADFSENGAWDVESNLEHETEWSLVLENPDRLSEVLDERLARALDTLSTNERRCFLLCQLHEFAYKEIAEMLGLPLGTVMSHVHRARMKLREKLAGLAVERRYVLENQP